MNRRSTFRRRRLALLASTLAWALAVAWAPDAAAQATASTERIAARCQARLEAIFAAGSFPGGSAALILPGGTELTFTVGLASREDDRPMRPADRMLSGSVGKTYVTAAVHHLVARGRLSLDERAAKHFADDEWYLRLPNAEAITVRQLLSHTTGIPRYVLDPPFWEVVVREPDKVWKPEELLAYVFDEEPRFAAGEGWSYADTNYIVLGMIVERVSGEPFYDYVREHLLEPHDLKDTVPSDRRRLSGLIQGYGGLLEAFGVPARVLEDGAFVFNPQFEWCGGGFMNTPLDLARWARILYSGAAFEGGYLETMLEGVPAPMLGPGTTYGLGVMIRQTSAGTLLGHDGVFPGYYSTMAYFPRHGIAAAFQINTDVSRSLGRPIHEVLVELVRLATETPEE